MKLVEDFSRVKILVVGDVMLDRYWWGNVTRISPEAPVPVVRIQRDSYVPGGAANVAVNVAGLGARVTLLGLIGDDPDGACLRDGLKKAGVLSETLVAVKTRPTNTKTRIIAHNQQVARVDRESTSALSMKEADLLCNAISEQIDGADVVVLSDYAKSTLSDRVLGHIFSLAGNSQKPVVVDPKGKDFTKYVGSTVLTPNRREAAEACNLEPEADHLVSQAGRRLLDKLQLRAVLITESEEGMTLFEKGQPPSHFEAAAKEVYDVTGAGDTVIATMAVALAAGADFRDAAKLANLAAGIVVQQLGTASISYEKLVSSLADTRQRLRISR